MGTKAAKKNRTRNHQVNFYMNDEEYRKLTKLVTESGLNKQTYLINATLGATLANPEALKDIPKLLSELTELLNQFKGIGINCNQMAKIANTYNQPANENELKELANDIHETGKEVLEDAFNRNRTVQAERTAITDEGKRERKVLEKPVREATEEYANPDADHRTPAEKNSTVGGKPGNGTFREWPVERLDRRVDKTAKRTRGIVDWGKKLRETFSHCLEQLRSFGFGSGLKSNTLETQADRVAEKIEEIRARVAAVDHTLRTQYLPSQGKDSWIDKQITLVYQEEYRLLDDLSELLKSTSPMVLALAQSKRNSFRPEKEVDMLKALTSNEFELTKEEVADSFTTALATADKMLSNVPSTMKSLEESHGCQPIDHNIVRRGRRR